MNPWSQYAAARLPPGAFPSPYLQPSPGPMGSHSPHSQISKSKSPITSQSSTHHNSPSHFSSHSSKTHENRDSLERRERDLYQQDEEDMDNSFLPRGPSPEPKIEDSECHRSQSAMLVLFTFKLSAYFLLFTVILFYVVSFATGTAATLIPVRELILPSSLFLIHPFLVSVKKELVKQRRKSEKIIITLRYYL